MVQFLLFLLVTLKGLIVIMTVLLLALLLDNFYADKLNRITDLLDKVVFMLKCDKKCKQCGSITSLQERSVTSRFVRRISISWHLRDTLKKKLRVTATKSLNIKSHWEIKQKELQRSIVKKKSSESE